MKNTRPVLLASIVKPPPSKVAFAEIMGKDFVNVTLLVSLIGAVTPPFDAKTALREAGKSLLPPGVSRCEGDFAAGDVVRLCDMDGTEFARGIARFDSAAVRARKLPKEELVHRDDLVIL